MLRICSAVLILSMVSACGGSRYASSNAAPYRAQSSTLFASGPISSACRAAGRKQASRARCGCVQAVADRSLNASEQRRGAVFFKDPHKAQVTRQSDNPANERFWRKWKAYSADAARLCT